MGSAYTTHIWWNANSSALAWFGSGEDRKKLIGIEILDVFLILEYSYSNFGHHRTTEPTADFEYLNMLKYSVAVTIREARIKIQTELSPQGS